MRILNLYAGIGGNRRAWGNDHEITAIEFNPMIAGIYKDFFPYDDVITVDAHKYLEDHFEEFDFIWSSPPCPSHSRVRKATGHQNKPIFPDMKLYEEILFLKHYFKGKWVVENVLSYYDPLIKPQELGQHYFWANFLIPPFDTNSRGHSETIEELQQRKGFDLTPYNGVDKRKILRNCVEDEVSKHIFKFVLDPIFEQLDILK